MRADRWLVCQSLWGDFIHFPFLLCLSPSFWLFLSRGASVSSFPHLISSLLPWPNLLQTAASGWGFAVWPLEGKYSPLEKPGTNEVHKKLLATSVSYVSFWSIAILTKHREWLPSGNRPLAQGSCVCCGPVCIPQAGFSFVRLDQISKVRSSFWDWVRICWIENEWTRQRRLENVAFPSYLISEPLKQFLFKEHLWDCCFRDSALESSGLGCSPLAELLNISGLYFSHLYMEGSELENFQLFMGLPNSYRNGKVSGTAGSH